ncbi:helix-turn-helix domain-containing protein [Hymenobacter guriensis]|uniref:Helix-turn-helix transcriptional regulator n=1 Tax=Hymenobacter guriensis TaxID=2793065 RepID=A0ABS0L7W9_9BACT|nr:helix-turn-helix transcriptional regulator [Hymenobacter guriensis]MBG8556174.1 helix-turn-helix transcriptional regulator [Hymenobacter guriensis]
MDQATPSSGASQQTDYQRRFAEGRAEASFTLQAVADVVGISKAAVSQFEKGKSSLSLDKFLKACEALNLRTEWVLHGKGKMFDGERPAPQRVQGRPARRL